MTRPRLLLVAPFSELQWTIRPLLEEWAEVASFDMPGLGAEPLPEGIRLDDSSRAAEHLDVWRAAGARRAVAEVEGRGWDRFVVVSDSEGSATAVRVAAARPNAVLGLAIGHAALSHATEGPRAPLRGEVWDVITQLARQGREAFVRYGIAQLTQGAIDEELAQKMIDRIPNMDAIAAMLEALRGEPEPIGEELRRLRLPLLLAKHEGCLGHTDEGFEDIVAAFPKAQTAICPEQCSASPAFAEAIRAFCEEVIG